ncbi:MAG: hypothetical protein ABIJ57_09660, partial [Pseudomonadota bacterium]
VEKMRQFRFRALLIEAFRYTVRAGDYRSEMAPNAVLATLDALSVRAGLHVYWCGTPRGAAAQLESLVRQFVRGIEKDYKRLEKAQKEPCGAASGKGSGLLEHGEAGTQDAG